MSGTYPEHDRMLAVKARSPPIGEFLDWLSAQGIRLAKFEEAECWRDEQLVQIGTPFETLLARYFEVDLRAVEAERACRKSGHSGKSSRQEKMHGRLPAWGRWPTERK